MSRLKDLRKAHSLSQKELADIVFVNQTAVSQWERGLTIPSFPILLKLAGLYNTTTDYLLGRVDEKESPANAELEKEHADLLESVADFTEEEAKELNNYINYLLSKRE